VCECSNREGRINKRLLNGNPIFKEFVGEEK
jgi:hypothetical protein